MSLAQRIFDQVEMLSGEGSDLADEGDHQGAIKKWSAAMDLLPEPKSSWDAYPWLSASLGDAYYQLNRLPEAREALFDALNGPDGQQNPFVHYRLGQTEVALGNMDSAVAHLLEAYMLDGEEIFLEDEEGGGAKYLQMLKDRRLVS